MQLYSTAARLVLMIGLMAFGLSWLRTASVLLATTAAFSVAFTFLLADESHASLSVVSGVWCLFFFPSYLLVVASYPLAARFVASPHDRRR